MGRVSALLETAVPYPGDRRRGSSRQLGVCAFDIVHVSWFGRAFEWLAALVGVGRGFSAAENALAVIACCCFDRCELAGICRGGSQRASDGCERRLLHLSSGGRNLGRAVPARAIIAGTVDCVCGNVNRRAGDGRFGIGFSVVWAGRGVFVWVLCVGQKIHSMFSIDQPYF